MLSHLRIDNAGPVDHLEVNPAPRLNLLTGDNGLGKSFLLDIIWWSACDLWSAGFNKESLYGKMALPKDRKMPSRIHSEWELNGEKSEFESEFQDNNFLWSESDSLLKSILVIQFFPDGSSISWDSSRNYNTGDRNFFAENFPNSPKAYYFSAYELWNGKKAPNDGTISRGLIHDTAYWKIEDGDSFKLLSEALFRMSPDGSNPLTFGEPRRVSPWEALNVITVNTEYGEVPITHISSAVRRILSIVYLLVWSWQEHKGASALRKIEPTKNISLIIDEIESHLHPKWQKTIIRSILSVMNLIAPDVNVQFFTSTHSPLVMASVEPDFDPEQDAWFDLDLVDGEVKIEKRPWYRRGDADAWLISEAFDQKTGYAPETELAIEEASQAMDSPDFDAEKAREIDAKLRALLAENSPFLRRWEYIALKKGWIL